MVVVVVGPVGAVVPGWSSRWGRMEKMGGGRRRTGTQSRDPVSHRCMLKIVVSPKGFGWVVAAAGGLSALPLHWLRAPGGAPGGAPTPAVVQGDSGDGGGEGIAARFLGWRDGTRLGRPGEGEISASQGGRHVCGR